MEDEDLFEEAGEEAEPVVVDEEQVVEDVVEEAAPEAEVAEEEVKSGDTAE